MRVHALIRATGGLALAMALLPATGAAQAAPALTIAPYAFKAPDGSTIEAELGSFTVPERRANPASRRITLRFVRFRSTAAKPGAPIIYLAGGPGASGIRTAAGPRFPLFMALRALGDVIALDQRGVGQSSTMTPCIARTPVDFTQPLTRAVLVQYTRDGLADCIAQWTAAGVDVDGYTTRESAADIDDLRKALGVPQVALWGISYGSHLGLAVLKYHGASVSRAVFAGIEGLEQTVKRPALTDSLFARVQRLIDADTAARAAFGDVATTMRRVHARLDSAPVTITATPPGTTQPRSVRISAFLVQLLVGSMIADPPNIARVPALYAALDAGQYESVAGRIIGQLGGVTMFTGMPELMDLASGIDPTRLALVEREAARGLLGDALNFPMPHVAGLRPAIDLGAAFRAPLQSNVPTLFISGTLDGRTSPAEAAVVRAGFRRGRALLVEHGGHNIFEADPRVAEAVVTFLRGEVPAERIVMTPPRFMVPR
ncbi:MAG: alpha/beta hydrolase [Gemmatimonadetes bacterium]|nr:alpha/beta hydrolase [Gemmatimonadota bacterium]